jgi:tetratricopeptide (TPR) repeat protein
MHSEPISVGGITSRVDRDQEIDTLLGSWKSVTEGSGQAVLVLGEAGIGKTRLAKEFIRQLDPDSFTLLDYCGSEYHTNIAFYPIIERLQRVYDIESLETSQQRQEFFQNLFGQDQEIDDQLLLAFEILLTNRGREMELPPELDPRDVKVAMRRAMFNVVKAAAQQQPVLIWVDDYQWLDYSSREVLNTQPSLLENLPIMVLFTCRPNPFLEQMSGWNFEQIRLDRFSREHGRELCANVFEEQLPPTELLDVLIERSDGVPLFLEELSASVLESSWSDIQDRETARTYSLDKRDIPTSLTGTIMARLDRLGEAKEVAHVAAVQGQVFDTTVVGSVCNLDDEALAKSLSLLLTAGLIIDQDNTGKTFRFKHALVREVAVQSLVKSQRRTLNLAVAKAVEAGKTDFTAPESDLLGQYYERAEAYLPACRYFLMAGRDSGRKSANVEAVNQLRQGLAVLDKLPESADRDELELNIRVTMIGPAIAVFGYAAADVEEVLSRALELLAKLPASPLIYPVLFSRWAVFQVLGRTRDAYNVALQTGQLAEQANDNGARLIGHRLLGTSYILLGDPIKGISELEKALALFDPEKHAHLIHICGTDPLVSAHALLAFARWFTGDAEKSDSHAQTTIDLAEQGGHANTIGYALSHMAILFAVRGDARRTRDVAERLLLFATRKELPFWIAHARAFQAWVLANTGDPAQALHIFMKGLEFLDQAGIIYWRPTYLSWIAQAHMACAERQKALPFLDLAEEVMGTSEECWMESEIWRLRGGNAADSEPKKSQKYYLKARAIAAKQKSLNLEIRVVIDHASLLAQQNEIEQAKAMLKDFLDEYPTESSPDDSKPAMQLLADLIARET